MLRLTPGATHKLTNGIKGSRRLSLPHFDGLPMDPWSGTPCKVESEARGEVILKLPLSAWVRQAALPAPARSEVKALPAPVTPPPPPPPPATKKGGDDRVDLVQAMRDYGRRIARVVDGVFLVEGERIEKPEVLELLNSYRRRNQLRPLDLAQVK